MATTLLGALAAMPIEQLKPGAQIEVTKTDGTVMTVTIGEWVESSDVEDVAQISYRPTWHTKAC